MGACVLHPGVHALPRGGLGSMLRDVGIRTTTAAELLGISPSTLRSWERRYGFPRPARSAGGHRQYERAEVEALRDAYAETGHAASAVALARGRGAAPPTHARLSAALTAFDEDAADRVLTEALAVRALEDVVEELLLAGIESLSADGPEHGLGVRWATGWLAAQRRLAPPATRAAGVLVLDAGGPDVVRVAALELVLRRAGLRVLVLPVALEPDRLARALAVLTPDLVVLGGRGADLDAIGRVVFAARRARGERVPVCDFAGALAPAAGSTVPSVGPGPVAARDAILALVERRVARDVPEVAPVARRATLRVVG
jgi:MerR family transcriptional regulator, light-induced transcriptional regulator